MDKNILEEKISLLELLDFCKQYDAYGKNSYMEHEYEGKALFMALLENNFNNYDSEKYFNYCED